MSRARQRDPMPPASLKVPGRTLADWLREVYSQHRTGRLEIHSDGGLQNLFFIGGDLYLAPEHPVFGVAEAWLTGARAPASSEAGLAELDSLGAVRPFSFRNTARQVLERIGSPESTEVAFVAGAGQIRIDLSGPLPTSQLVMESAVVGKDQAALLRQLGGEKVMLQASPGRGSLDPAVELDPQEAFLLTRLEQPMAVGELVTQLDLGRQETLKRICRLRAISLIRSVDEAESISKKPDRSKVVADRLAERIAESLREDPLDIDTDQHRELLRSLFNRIGAMTHFEVLAVSPHSSDEEVHKAFIELGRILHPDNAVRLGMAGKEGVFAVLFERATEAYLTLSDPDRKIRYSEEVGPVGALASSAIPESQRQQEKQALARRQYETALGLADRLEFHSAIQLLEQAASADPQPEYFTLLGDCQAENPQWLDRAAFSYQRAMEMQPDDPSLRVKLGRAYERRGDSKRAQESYEAALELAPGMEQAEAGLMRIAPERLGTSRAGFLQRFFGFFRGGRGKS